VGDEKRRKQMPRKKASRVRRKRQMGVRKKKAGGKPLKARPLRLKKRRGRK